MGLLSNRESESRQARYLRLAMCVVKKIASYIGGFGGICSTASDATCDHLAGLARPQSSLRRGYVVRSGLGSYDCEVVLGDGTTVTCSTLSPVANQLAGVSQACVPVAGSCVLVMVTSSGLAEQPAPRGIVLGVIPENDTGGISVRGESLVTKLGDTDHPEAGVSQFTESGPAAIASDVGFLGKGEFQCGRPHDMVPGEYALLNHSGAGLVIGALSTEVRGSAAASVRCSELDDQVSVTSGHFRHISSAGGEEIFNDNGFITVESFVSMYQAERLGAKSACTPSFNWKPIDPESARERDAGASVLVSGQTAKKRYYRYAGYLGDAVNVFVSSPDPAKAFETMDSESRDQGLFHQHVDSSGRLTVRSASGILFERYDRIPVPKRRHYAWDPAGDGDTEAAPKLGFELPEKYPMADGLVIGDMAAWWNGLAYSRFMQFREDFSVPKQSDLKCPDRQYDELGKASEEFEKYDLRHSYMGLTPDGGVVIRDAWGSEIVMADGRITFNAAANIEIRSGSSVVVLGGHDVVVKAHDSVDLSATEKDVRVKAEKNMQMVSCKGGVLLQSKAIGTSNEWDKPGEDVKSSGVTIKADDSHISVRGLRTHVQGMGGVDIAAFDAYGKPNGSVVLSGASVKAVADSQLVTTVKGTSGLVLYESSAAMLAPSVLMVGGQSAGTMSGDQFMVGIPVDAPSMYSMLASVCGEAMQTYGESDTWLEPLTSKVFSKVDFSYRTDSQYGTDRDSGVLGGVFSVYQPSWAVMAEARRKPMQAVRTGAWEEKPDGAGEFPWPGKAAMQGQSYVTYRELNIRSDGTEDPKQRKAQLTAQAFSSYHIRKQD